MPHVLPPTPVSPADALHELTPLHVLSVPHLPHVVADLQDLARRVDRIADDVRRTQERLQRHAATVVWESAAATAYQHRAAAHAAGLARCALLVDEVAADLRHHAVVVHDRVDAVCRAAEEVRDGVGEILRELP